MRIHRLTLQAVGPFPGRHTIDVDQLSAGGLFLLEGPTGAGKSTIIDAVVFALYGKVAGAEASDERLHSDHAAPGVEPFVDMVFSTAAGIYRVWRSPKFERPKQRGTGTITQNARAKLWRLAAAEHETGEALSAHVQEVATELGRIVVLDRAQFTQTVVLPQGQFASFLRAKPEDRRAVLQEVFGTEVYEKVQKQLTEMAKDARTRLTAATAEVGSAVTAFVQAAGLNEADDAHEAVRTELLSAATELDSATLRDRSHQVLADAKRAAGLAGEDEERARLVARESQRELDTRTRLAERLTRRATLLRRQRELEEREPEIAEAAARLSRAQRAATVANTLRAHHAARQRHTDAVTALTAQLAHLNDDELAPVSEIIAERAPNEVDADHLTRLTTLVDACTDERGALTEMLTLEAALPRRAEELRAEEARLQSTNDRIAEQRALLDARPARRTEVDHQVSGAREEAAQLDGARAAVEAATARMSAAERVAERTEALAGAHDRLTQAATAARTALDTEHELRRRRVDGLAGELAQDLKDGLRCPVCGSAEHPAPAEPAPDHPTAERVETAAAARAHAERELAAAGTAQARIEAELDAARVAAQGRDVAQARTELSDARSAVADAERAGQRAAQLTTELTGFDAETSRLSDQLAQVRTEHAAATERLAAARHQLATDRERCAQAAGGADTVTDRVQQLARQIAVAKDVCSRVEERLAAERALRDTEEWLDGALTEAQFADAEAARAAALPTDQIRALDELVASHGAALSTVREGLAEEGIAELTGEEQPQLAAAEQAVRFAQEELTVATRECAAARRCAEQTAAARHTLLRALDHHGTQSAEVAPVLRMAGLASGGEGNESATTLATFVLLRRFEDVVAAANERLVLMSDGRYCLERIDTEGGQRSRKAGLGLQVRDHLTEAPRDPHTLSGGETFYVSLCLALGLADVVRSEAGGIELGTLFVDEGFGSLDPETLDGVMAELTKLQSGGRAVGIVSHVAELKGRIAERIEVRRLATGSSTLTVRA